MSDRMSDRNSDRRSSNRSSDSRSSRSSSSRSLSDQSSIVSSNLSEQRFKRSLTRDCPHLSDALSDGITVDLRKGCYGCSEITENWLCITCSEVYCSRYIKDHMAMRGEHTTHAEKEIMHPIIVSFTDARVWCYLCEAYIVAPVLRPICQAILVSKHN